MNKLPLKLRFYILSVYAITVVLLISHVKLDSFSIYQDFGLKDIVLFTLLIALTETLTVPFKTHSFSTSFAVLLSSYMQFGLFFTIIVTVLGFSLRIIKLSENRYQHILNTPYYGTLYNYCVIIIPVMCGSYFYKLFYDNFPIDFSKSNVISIILFCFIFFTVNTFLMSVLLSIRMNKKILYMYISNIKLSFLNNVAMAPFGILLTYLFQISKHWGVFIVIFPIGLARYTFSLYIDARSQYFQTVDALMKATEARDTYTEGHSQRVGDLAIKIAKELKYSEFKMEQLKIASILHDVGKIGIDDSILNKPSKLTQEEFDRIKQHPNKGYEILKKVKNLEGILPIVLHHHERYDGKGYPEQKKSDELGIEVFIVQLADSVDAMATDRPYRKAMAKEQIIEEVKNNSGTQFHPKVVEAYLKVLRKENS